MQTIGLLTQNSRAKQEGHDAMIVLIMCTLLCILVQRITYQFSLPPFMPLSVRISNPTYAKIEICYSFCNASGKILLRRSAQYRIPGWDVGDRSRIPTGPCPAHHHKLWGCGNLYRTPVWDSGDGPHPFIGPCKGCPASVPTSH